MAENHARLQAQVHDTNNETHPGLTVDTTRDRADGVHVWNCGGDIVKA